MMYYVRLAADSTAEYLKLATMAVISEICLKNSKPSAMRQFRLLNILANIASMAILAMTTTASQTEWIIGNEAVYRLTQKQAIRRRNMSEWISVEDRMPEAYEWVLIYEPDAEETSRSVRCSFARDNGTWYGGFSDLSAEEVTHWMPIPEPPKEVE